MNVDVGGEHVPGGLLLLARPHKARLQPLGIHRICLRATCLLLLLLLLLLSTLVVVTRIDGQEQVAARLGVHVVEAAIRLLEALQVLFAQLVRRKRRAIVHSLWRRRGILNAVQQGLCSR